MWTVAARKALGSKKLDWFVCRGTVSVTGDGGAIQPGMIFGTERPWPPTLKAFAEAGVVEQLDGEPATGIEFSIVSSSYFAQTTRPEPEPIKLMSTADVLAKLGKGWDAERLKIARAKLGFPRQCGTRTHDDSRSGEFKTWTEPLYDPAAVDQWIESMALAAQ